MVINDLRCRCRNGFLINKCFIFVYWFVVYVKYKLCMYKIFFVFLDKNGKDFVLNNILFL